MPYIFKAEIGGIQEFIFSVKTKAAAKSLKGRSFLVDAACILTAKNILKLFSDTKEVYVGGGNIYLEIKDEQWNETIVSPLVRKIKQQLLDYQLILNWTALHFLSLDNFGDCINLVNRDLSLKKLKPAEEFDNFFMAFKHDKTGEDAFVAFAKSYSGNSSYKLKEASENAVIVNDAGITLGHFCLEFVKTNERLLIPLPVWNMDLYKMNNSLIKDLATEDDSIEEDDISRANIIGFNYLAGFAKRRTGTQKIAVLKLDIDNLGKVFQMIKDRRQSELLSKRVSTFFSKNIIEILNRKFSYTTPDTDENGDVRFDILTLEIENKKRDYRKYKLKQKSEDRFCDNIYPVFAGGDDCLFIGAWDAIVEFAIVLKKEFELFEALLRKEISVLKGPLTISAAVLIVDSHFPVTRFADQVDQALENAKTITHPRLTDAAGKPMKNNISIMGHVFSWDQFYELVKVKDILRSMILEYGESSAFLQRIIQSFDSSDISKWHFCNPPKPFNPAILWRFLYSFRDILDKPYFIKNFKAVFFNEKDGYHVKYINNNFLPEKKLSHTLPVAARLTEFLTKLKIS